MVRFALAALLATAGCTSDRMKVAFEGEDDVELGDVTPRPVGQGLIVHLDVIHEHADFGDEDPTEVRFTADQLTIGLSGATQVACTAPTGLCLIADRPGDLRASFTTPDGPVDAVRTVTADIQLSANTPRWGHAPVAKLQLEAGTASAISLVYTLGGEPIAGHALAYETTGDITLADRTLTAGAPGTAMITATGAPLELAIVDRATSLATLASFTADRMFERPLERPLSAYTEGSVGAVVFEGFDAAGFLALAGLPLVVTGGPGVTATSYPVPGQACTTNDYCFLRGSLAPGVAESMSYVDVAVGGATQRFAVRIVRGGY